MIKELKREHSLMELIHVNSGHGMVEFRIWRGRIRTRKQDHDPRLQKSKLWTKQELFSVVSVTGQEVMGAH